MTVREIIELSEKQNEKLANLSLKDCIDLYEIDIFDMILDIDIRKTMRSYYVNELKDMLNNILDDIARYKTNETDYYETCELIHKVYTIHDKSLDLITKLYECY